MIWIALIAFVLGFVHSLIGAPPAGPDPGINFAMVVIGAAGLVPLLRGGEDGWGEFIEFVALAGVLVVALSLLWDRLFSSGALSRVGLETRTLLVCGVLLYYFTGGEDSAAGEAEPDEEQSRTH